MCADVCRYFIVVKKSSDFTKIIQAYITDTEAIRNCHNTGEVTLKNMVKKLSHNFINRNRIQTQSYTPEPFYHVILRGNFLRFVNIANHQR